MSFITKYKPVFFDDYESDKKDIMKILSYLLESNTMNILLVGAENCGKSTLLESIIKEYSKMYGVMDETYILRLNNIKEQGIQYFRNDLRFFCQNITLHKMKKLIVIDDIDTIPEQGQQILGSCIDKYSGSANFITSCLNVQKVIHPLQTSLLTMQVPSISEELKAALFRRVLSNENILLSLEAQQFLLQLSPNIKNMLNNLQKCKLYIGESDTCQTVLGLEIIRKLVCNIDARKFDTFADHLRDKNIEKATEILLALFDSGYSVIDILDHFFAHVTRTNLYSDEEKYKIVKVITVFTGVFHSIHEDSIELPLFVNNLVKIF